MPSSSSTRRQVEAALADRIPSALTPPPRVIRPVAGTGVVAVDDLLEGGVPIGAISEFTGPQSSGRTSLALSFVASLTQKASVVAWVDATDNFDPESAASAGVNLTRLLWVRCGARHTPDHSASRNSFKLPEKYLTPSPIKKGLHGGGHGPHPRTEARDLPEAVSGFLHSDTMSSSFCGASQQRIKPQGEVIAPISHTGAKGTSNAANGKPWKRIEQALRVADLLLQAGGFAAIVLDFGGLSSEYVARVPMATWFRYRAAAERTHACVLLLTEYPCAKSSGELLLRFQPGEACDDEATIFTGIAHRVEVERRRFTQTVTNVVSIRKPPRRETGTNWRSRAVWGGAQ